MSYKPKVCQHDECVGKDVPATKFLLFRDNGKVFCERHAGADKSWGSGWVLPRKPTVPSVSVEVEQEIGEIESVLLVTESPEAVVLLVTTKTKRLSNDASCSGDEVIYPGDAVLRVTPSFGNGILHVLPGRYDHFVVCINRRGIERAAWGQDAGLRLFDAEKDRNLTLRSVP